MRGFLRQAPPSCCSLNLAILVKLFGHYFMRSLKDLNPQAPIVKMGFSEMILTRLGIKTFATTMLAF